jgi:selenocysteine-specific elongation factor
MRRHILGTAGHIDHGKTALVKALTGVDTDRLKEEKERGITVDLGFAELHPTEDVRFGVVDVPGHEGFIRNMVAGATGVDLVLLVVAADEGVMPQTREHLAIVRYLGVPGLVVALTKADLVEEEWLELVREEVEELLAETPYRDSPVLPVSAVEGRGLEELTDLLASLGEAIEERGQDDVFRLPVDRVFTIRGAGTVVTGTLWSGRLRVGDRVRILPGEKEARIRGLQLHGKETEEATAGSRVAVALTGSGISHQEIHRGQTLVEGEGWESSWMLTCRTSVLPDTGWALEQGQRVRVHLGTAEVLARVALLETDLLAPGEEGWAQLRLEEPLVARVKDSLVLRSYSPVTTMGGGRVAEVSSRKRKRVSPSQVELLEQRLSEDPRQALLSHLETAGWSGAEVAALPQHTGLAPTRAREVVERAREGKELHGLGELLFHRNVWEEGEERLLEGLRAFHEAEPLRPGLPLQEFRQRLPGAHGSTIADALLEALVDRGALRSRGGLVALAGFRPRLTPRQESLRNELRHRLREAGLAPPTLKELAEEVDTREEIRDILRLMEEDGDVLALEGDLYFWREAVREAGRDVVEALGGEGGFGPADFREVLDLTRKHLLPLLRHFDTEGITTRVGDERSVAGRVPADWGTSKEDPM